MGGQDPDLLGPAPPPGPERTWPGAPRRRFGNPDSTARRVPFPGALLDALSYPFRSWTAIFFIVTLAVAVDTLRLLSQPGVLLMGRVLAWGLMGLGFSWGFRIFEESWGGNDRVPTAVDLSEPAELVRDGVKYGCAYLSAFWPGLLLAWTAGEEPGALPWLGVLNVLGALHLPMALMLVGMTGSSRSAFNYLLAWRSAKLIPRDFLFTAFFFQLQKNLVAFVLLLAWTRTPGLGHGEFGIAQTGEGFDLAAVNPWLHLGGTILEVHFIAVSMRALGLLLRAHGGAMGWFRERGGPREAGPGNP